jgi:Zn-dependent peptidase ImmA (M78 family)
MPKADYEKVQPSWLPKQTVMTFAENVARQLGHKPGGDVVAALKKLGGRIGYKDFWDLENGDSGSIEIHNVGDFDVYVASHTSGERDYFTIAHEIGHYVLHYLLPKKKGATIQKAYANRYGSEREEWEANWFAAAFLMPKAAFEESFNRNNKNLVLVASEFGVSTKAAEVRAKALKLMA